MNRNILLAALLIAGSASAAKPSAGNWPQEPSSILGLSFESQSVMNLPQCEAGVIGFQQKRFCRNAAYGGNYYTLDGKPSLGLQYNYHFAAKLAGSQVEYFSLSGNTADFDTVLALFTEKYGRPKSSTRPEVKTKAGASFFNDTYVWDGRTVRITLERYFDDINTYGALISNKPASEAAAQDAQKSIKSSASKL